MYWVTDLWELPAMSAGRVDHTFLRANDKVVGIPGQEAVARGGHWLVLLGLQLHAVLQTQIHGELQWQAGVQIHLRTHCYVF